MNEVSASDEILAPAADPADVPAGPPPDAADDARRARWAARAAWLVPGAVMAVLGSAGLTGAGLWADELATWGFAKQTWAQSGPTLAEVDRVFVPYYAMMKGWVTLFGDSDVALRLPSLLATVVAVALTGAIGARVAGARAGLLSGVLLALLPGMSRYGQEVRPYAFAALAAVVATYLLLRLLERPSWRWLAGYAAAVALVGAFHLVTLLLLAAHGLIVAIRRRDLFTRWGLAVTAGVLPVLPLVWSGLRQSSQISWIALVSTPVPTYLLVGFGGIAPAAAVGVLALLGRPLRPPGRVFAAWAVVPLAGLLAVSLLTPLMQPRYLLFTLPGWALLAGTALARPGVRWAAAALAVVAALVLPQHLAIRSPAGHEDQGTRELARIVDDGYRPGDAVVYAERDADNACCSWLGRDAILHYVRAGRRPTDGFPSDPANPYGQLLRIPECQDAVRCLGTPPRIWIVRLKSPQDPLSGLGTDKEQLVRDRYRLAQVWRLPQLTLALAVTR